jgi:hypothetical protein
MMKERGGRGTAAEVHETRCFNVVMSMGCVFRGEWIFVDVLASHSSRIFGKNLQMRFQSLFCEYHFAPSASESADGRPILSDLDNM